MKRLFSLLLASIMLLGIASIAPAAGAEEKYIYESDLTKWGGPVGSPVVFYGHVAINSDYVAFFHIKTDNMSTRLGITMNVQGLPGQRHNVYLGDIWTNQQGDGKVQFNLSDYDAKVPNPNLTAPTFTIFSYGPPGALEASSRWPIYSNTWDSDNGTIEIKAVYRYESAPPTWPNWNYDASWLAYPVIVSPSTPLASRTFDNLRPRYYAITYHTPPANWTVNVTFMDPSGDTIPMSPPSPDFNDRTLIVNLGAGEKVTVTYTYTYTPPPPPPLP